MVAKIQEKFKYIMAPKGFSIARAFVSKRSSDVVEVTLFIRKKESES